MYLSVKSRYELFTLIDFRSQYRIRTYSHKIDFLSLVVYQLSHTDTILKTDYFACLSKLSTLESPEYLSGLTILFMSLTTLG